jgi:hypothetical protein
MVTFRDAERAARLFGWERRRPGVRDVAGQTGGMVSSGDAEASRRPKEIVVDDVPDVTPDADILIEDLGDVDLFNLPLPDYPGDYLPEE